MVRTGNERRTEVAVEKANQKKRTLENDMLELERRAEKFGISREVAPHLAVASTLLETTDSFFKQYCDKGNSDNAVDQSNYRQVGKELALVQGKVAKADSNITPARDAIALQQQLVSTRQNLDALISEIKSDNPPSVFLGKADAAYQSAIACLKGKQVARAQEYSQTLSQIRIDARDFAQLPSKLEQVISSIRSVAIEPEAISLANTSYEDGKSAVGMVDVSRLRQDIDKLSSMNQVLNQEYTIRIHLNPSDPEGDPSGFPMLDDNNEKPKEWFLVVEAVDGSGRIIPVEVTSSFGNTSEVSKWAQKVPEQVYNRVLEDYSADYRIDKNIFGYKKKGYLNEVITFPGADGRTPLQSTTRAIAWPNGGKLR
jgi:hypothetical protein